MDGRRQSQAERFRETARQLEADESDDALDRAFEKIDPKHKPDDENAKKKPGS